MMKDLMEQVNNMHEQMENFNREMEAIGKIPVKMVEIKGNITYHEFLEYAYY